MTYLASILAFAVAEKATSAPAELNLLDRDRMPCMPCHHDGSKPN